jgi:hypothetical protein
MIATGINKRVQYKKEVTWGTQPGATSAQLLRRITSTLDLAKDAYQSQEIRTDYQVSDYRHGMRKVAGNVNGELSGGTYKDFMAAAVRAAFASGATTGAVVTITAAAAAPQFVRSSGSFITDGFSVGQVVRHSGWSSGATANNARNFLITALTATNMSGIFLDGTAVTAKASGDSVTIAVQGKQAAIPLTGHTNDSFSIEHFFADIVQSELFTGCRVAKMDVKLPATGMSTVDFAFMGKDMVPASAAYFTSPAVQTTSRTYAAVNGALFVAGVQVGLITSLDFSLNANMSVDAVVGSNTTPDVIPGEIMVTGSLTAYFQDATLRDIFNNETEASVVCAFTADNTGAAEFMAFTLPRIKAGGNQKSDGDKGIVQTIPFTALLNVAGGGTTGTLQTTLAIQDSLA